MVPVVDILLKRLDEGRVFHGGCLDDMVVKENLDVIDGRQDADVRVLVWHEAEPDHLPLRLHLGQSLHKTQTIAN